MGAIESTVVDRFSDNSALIMVDDCDASLKIRRECDMFQRSELFDGINYHQIIQSRLLQRSHNRSDVVLRRARVETCALVIGGNHAHQRMQFLVNELEVRVSCRDKIMCVVHPHRWQRTFTHVFSQCSVRGHKGRAYVSRCCSDIS